MRIFIPIEIKGCAIPPFGFFSVNFCITIRQNFVFLLDFIGFI